MRGTRYGDFSRFAPDWRKGYRSVLMQQGRVQLDSDWNDQVVLGQHALRQALEDMLGGSGAPAADAGFEITPEVALELGRGTTLEVPDAHHLLPRADRPYTLEMWLSWSGGHGTLLHCSEEDGGRAGFRLHIHRDATVSCTVACPSDKHVTTRTESPLARDTWMHVAVVFEHRHAALVIDGRQVARTHLHEGCPSHASRLVLGRHGGTRWPDENAGDEDGTEGHDLHLSLGGLRIWDEARALAQLAPAVRPAPSEPPAPHELAYWPLTQSDSRIVTDVVEGKHADIRGERRPRWRLVDLSIGAGRYYVDGVACELESPVTYTTQPGCSQRSLPDRGDRLVYIETWEQSVDAVQDPSLLERALGGVDTTVRTCIQSCVRLAHWNEDDDEDARAPLEHLLQEERRRTTGKLSAEFSGDAPPGNYLYRVEVHRGGHATAEDGEDGTIDIEVIEVDVASAELVLAVAWPEPDDSGAEVEIEAVDEQGAVVVRRHRIASIGSGARGHRLRLDVDVRQLAGLDVRRVRRERRAPTFKWSRRNGAETFAIAPVEPRSSTVQVLGGSRSYEPLAEGDVVEVLDDAVPLDGKPHRLLTVVAASGHDRRTLELSGQPADEIARQAARRPFLRRWDQKPADGTTVRVVTDRWIELEDGVTVRFERGHYRRGDYWWVVARQDEPFVEWPDTHGLPTPLPPDGVERRVAPLARLRVEHSRVYVDDLRRIFFRPSREEGAEPASEVEDGPVAGVLGAAEEPDPAPPEEPESGLEPGPEPEPQREAATVAREPSAVADSPQDEAGSSPAPAAPGGSPEPAVVLGTAGAPPPGYAPSGVELVVRPRWSRAAATGIPASSLRGMAAVPGKLAVATADALFAVGPAGVEQLATLGRPRQGFSIAAVGPQVVFVGGGPEGARPDGATFVFDTASRAWMDQPAPMPAKLERSAVAVAAGLVHVLGGAGRRPTDAHQVYDPSANRWTKLPSMPIVRVGAVAATLGGSVFIAGGTGRRASAAPLAEHHVFDPGTTSWRSAGPLPGAQHVHDAASGHDQYIVLADDIARAGVRTFLRYVSEVARWEPLPALPGPGPALAMTAHPAGFVAAGADEAGQLLLYEMTLAPEFTIFVRA